MHDVQRDEVTVPGPPAPSGWRTGMATVPAVGLALLPKVTCPACWPVYAGVLSALGFGFLLDSVWLLPLTGLFLLVAVGALAFRARRRRGYGPFCLGLAAASFVMVGKFVLDIEWMMYGGVALLVGASLWNSWPQTSRESASPPCPNCASSATRANHERSVS